MSELLLLTRWPRRVERIFLAILFCTIAEPAIAQLNFELPGQCAGVPTLSEQFAPSITSKKPTPPASVPESAANSLSALQNAADDGDLIAQWKLGRMYADGDGVAQDDLHAFEYFRRIADTHAEDSPSAPQAAIVANAFVALGRYYLSGIPNSSIKADPEWAREMFSYAASHLGNNAMTILALIIQLYGGTWELPMPSMKACRTFVATMAKEVERPPFIYCIPVGAGWLQPKTQESSQEHAPYADDPYMVIPSPHLPPP